MIEGKKLQETILKALFYSIGYLLYHLPRSVSMFIGKTIGDIFYFFHVKRRRLALFNVKFVFKDKISLQHARYIVRNSFRNMGKTLIEFIMFPFYTRENLEEVIEGAENIQLFREVLDKKKGALLYTAHFGNWEILGAYVSLCGYPLWALNREQKGVLGKIVDDYRKAVGMKLIYKNTALSGARKAVRKGEILGFLADQGGVMRSTFFEGMTLLPQIGGAFGLKLGLPIVPTFLLWNEDDTYRLYIGPVIELEKKRKYSKEELREAVEELIKILERWIYMHPEQWFWMQRFWIGVSPGNYFQKHVKFV